MLFEMPRTPRQLFDCFCIYDPEVGISSLLDHIDFSRATTRDVYYACHERYPESASLCTPAGGNEAIRGLLAEGLLSDEFQTNITERFLGAYPEKTRLIFVHIPKCAGTDLTERLENKYPSIHQRLREPAWTLKPRLFFLLSELSAWIRHSEFIFLSGHIPTVDYISKKLVRPTDRIFTVVRRPNDMILSGVNYIVTLFYQDPEGKRPDVRDWFEQLGMRAVDPAMSDTAVEHLARRILHTPGMISKDWTCVHLGLGTAQSAIEQMIISDIEIIDTSNYRNWLDQNWTTKPADPVNVSKKVMTEQSLTVSDQAVVDHLTSEDRKLYDIVKARIDAGPTLSIRGSQLSHL